MQMYKVRRGDSLFNIAKKFYGDGDTYTLLAQYNHLKSPDALEIGQVLSIPPLEELRLTANPLSEWHNYHDGTIFWRTTVQGVEIRGKGVVLDQRLTKQVAGIWKQYQQPILAASKKYGVPVPVLFATISTESSGNSKAYRYEPAFYERHIKNKETWKKNPFYKFPKRIAASYGLVQIMYTTACSVGFSGDPEDLYDPAVNLDAGAAYIASPSQLAQHAWDPPKIACAYNAGSVHPTKQNAWGIFCHAGHLDRWIPSYNAAIQVTKIAEIPQPPKPLEPQPQPQPMPDKPTPPQDQPAATLRVLFAKAQNTSWKPVVVDLFKHSDHGADAPVSYTIQSPTVDRTIGYTYDIPKVTMGVYDVVFSDADSGAVLYDIADYAVDTKLEILDVRQKLVAAPGVRAFSEEQESGGSKRFWAWVKRLFRL